MTDAGVGTDVSTGAVTVTEVSADPGWEFRPVTAVREFPRTGWGHRGYEEQAVDEFAARVQRDLLTAQEQINDLRDEVDRLHRYIRRQWAAVSAAEAGRSAGHGSAAGPGSAPDPATQHAATPVGQARAVLAQAQEIAERRIEEATARLTEADRAATGLLAQTKRLITDRLAEAEQLVVTRLSEADDAASDRLYRADVLAEDVLTQARRAAEQKRAQAQDDVRRLLALGRSRYEEIIVQAHRRADEAAELALHDFEQAAYHTEDSGRARAELDMKAAYLRTFATVSRAALQAALDVTNREFDRVLGVNVPIDGAELGLAGTAPADVLVLPQGGAARRVITMPGLENAIELVRVSRSG